MNRLPFILDQRFLFRSAPALDLALGPKCLVPFCELLAPRKDNGATLLRISLDQPGLMGRYARFEVIRVSNIVAPVGAPQNVCPEAHSNLSRAGGAGGSSSTL